MDRRAILAGSPPPSTRGSIDALLAEAEARIVRYSPEEALTAAADAALLVDTRSEDDRERDGIVPGSLHIPRTVLEWRTALDSPWRNPHLEGLDQQIILLCDHGYSSIFAAAMLVDLGYATPGDVKGGYLAWHAAGLPTTAAPRRRGIAELAGMRGRDT